MGMTAATGEVTGFSRLNHHRFAMLLTALQVWVASERVDRVHEASR